MFKVFVVLGFLCVVWGDEYHPVRDHYHPVRDHYHPQRELTRVQRDHYHPRTVVTTPVARDHYHPHHPVQKPISRDHYHPHKPYRPLPVDQKIVGGEQTTIEDLSYQTSLRFITTHTCGAAIIDERTAITAAHCVYGRRRSSSFTLMSGTTYINDNTHPGKLSFVDRVIIHEGYNTTSQDNDIAILKLFQPLQFSDKIKPIALQDAGNDVAPLTAAVVSGWGRTQEGKPNPPGPSALRKATVSVLSRGNCEARYPGKLTGSMMCAQTPGRDSCQGDSGGPLVANNKLVGVVSWGYGCARPEYPGVYTSIAALRPWIEKHRND